MSLRWLSLWFAALLMLSLYSRWHVMEARADRCSLDGSRIAPIHRVDLLADGVALESFCCVRCAGEWPVVPDGARWQVRDELSGRVLDANLACFVESGVVTQNARRDHTHSFQRWSDALTHIADFGGERIQNPFGETSPRADDDPDQADDESDD